MTDTATNSFPPDLFDRAARQLYNDIFSVRAAEYEGMTWEIKAEPEAPQDPYVSAVASDSVAYTFRVLNIRDEDCPSMDHPDDRDLPGLHVPSIVRVTDRETGVIQDFPNEKIAQALYLADSADGEEDLPWWIGGC